MLEAHFLHFPLENGPSYRYVETPPQDSNQESSDSHLFSSKKRSRLLVQEERTLHPRGLRLGSVAKKKANGVEPRKHPSHYASVQWQRRKQTDSNQGIFRFATLLVKEERKAPCQRREDPSPSQFDPRHASTQEASDAPAPSPRRMKAIRPRNIPMGQLQLLLHAKTSSIRHAYC